MAHVSHMVPWHRLPLHVISHLFSMALPTTTAYLDWGKAGVRLAVPMPMVRGGFVAASMLAIRQQDAFLL